MFRLSEKIAKLEDRCGKRFERLRERHKGKWSFYFLLGAVCLYFYGMFINSIRLGVQSTFNATGQEIDTIWVVNPFRNLFAVFSPTGFGVTAVGALLFCLMTKKGYRWFSGYRYIRDRRGFDILPDGTHGTARFLSRKEQEKIVQAGSLDELTGTIIGDHHRQAEGQAG